MVHPISFRAGGFHVPRLTREVSSIVSIFPLTVDAERTERRTVLRMNLERGLLVSALVHVLLVGLYYGVEYLKSQEVDALVMRVRIMKYSGLGPPPSITDSLTAPVVGVAKIGKPSIEMPIPVPDAEINPEQTIATQTDMSSVVGPAIETGEGERG